MVSFILEGSKLKLAREAVVVGVNQPLFFSQRHSEHSINNVLLPLTWITQSPGYFSKPCPKFSRSIPQCVAKFGGSLLIIQENYIFFSVMEMKFNRSMVWIYTVNLLKLWLYANSHYSIQ
jgi:hypothetical protein